MNGITSGETRPAKSIISWLSKYPSAPISCAATTAPAGKQTVDKWTCADGMTVSGATGPEQVYVISAPQSVKVSVTIAPDKTVSPSTSILMMLQQTVNCGPDLPKEMTASDCLQGGQTAISFSGTGQPNQRLWFDGISGPKNLNGYVKGTAKFTFTPQ